MTGTKIVLMILLIAGFFGFAAFTRYVILGQQLTFPAATIAGAALAGAAAVFAAALRLVSALPSDGVDHRAPRHWLRRARAAIRRKRRWRSSSNSTRNGADGRARYLDERC